MSLPREILDARTVVQVPVFNRHSFLPFQLIASPQPVYRPFQVQSWHRRRPDKRQLVLGLMTTREGLPVGHLTLPGSTADLRSLEEAVRSLLGRVPGTKPILVLDRGMVSEANLARLAEAGWQYIVGVKLRQYVARRALGRPGRYAKVCENLYVKEVAWENGPPGERLIVCYNPLEAKVDAEARRRMVSQLEEMAGDRGGVPRTLLRSQAARRYLKVEGGKVRLDRAKIREDARYDGKWVLRTNCDLPPGPGGAALQGSVAGGAGIPDDQEPS